jgi:phospholipase C
VVPASNLPADPAANPIDHVVVLMLENRSYDTYFGWLEGSRGFLELGLDLSYTDPDTGETLSPRHWAPEYRRCGHPDPGHGWAAGRAQLAQGFLAGSNDEYALAYYLPEDIQTHARLARQFTVFDDYFCSVLGPTYPNRLYAMSGWSGGYKSNYLPPQSPNPDHRTGYPWPSIFDRLEEAGISWGDYFVDLPSPGLFGPRTFHAFRHIEQFYADAKAGTLPQFTWIDPGYLGDQRTDDHPGGADTRASQAFVNNLVHSVVTGPQWSRTALFITYDEWGGFFDHVTPPRTDDDPLANAGNLEEDFGQRGFRVPMMAISPYSRKGYVHQDGPYDHTSILRFLEYRFGLEPLTERDANARNIGEVFDYAQAPRLHIGIEQVETPTVFYSSGCPSGESEEAALTDFDRYAEWLRTIGFVPPEKPWETLFGFGQGDIATVPAGLGRALR